MKKKTLSVWNQSNIWFLFYFFGKDPYALYWFHHYICMVARFTAYIMENNKYYLRKEQIMEEKTDLILTMEDHIQELYDELNGLDVTSEEYEKIHEMILKAEGRHAELLKVESGFSSDSIKLESDRANLEKRLEAEATLKEKELELEREKFEMQLKSDEKKQKTDAIIRGAETGVKVGGLVAGVTLALKQFRFEYKENGIVTRNGLKNILSKIKFF